MCNAHTPSLSSLTLLASKYLRECFCSFVSSSPERRTLTSVCRRQNGRVVHNTPNRSYFSHHIFLYHGAEIGHRKDDHDDLFGYLHFRMRFILLHIPLLSIRVPQKKDEVEKSRTVGVDLLDLDSARNCGLFLDIFGVAGEQEGAGAGEGGVGGGGHEAAYWFYITGPVYFVYAAGVYFYYNHCSNCHSIFRSICHGLKLEPLKVSSMPHGPRLVRPNIS